MNESEIDFHYFLRHIDLIFCSVKLSLKIWMNISLICYLMKKIPQLLPNAFVSKKANIANPSKKNCDVVFKFFFCTLRNNTLFCYYITAYNTAFSNLIFIFQTRLGVWMH